MYKLYILFSDLEYILSGSQVVLSREGVGIGSTGFDDIVRSWLWVTATGMGIVLFRKSITEVVVN